MQDHMQKQFVNAQDFAVKSVRAWNELLMASTDMAFDVVLKNWNYNRSLRNSADQAIEDTINTQHRLASEMMEVWKGYTTNVQEIIGKTVDGETQD
jgi:hypothetical protein